ncbi:MAG: lactate dehydrogenase [Rhodospirillaceae bacterium]|nr:lactate dehydrogenase [Rhodospirillaceae bacterium]
MAAYPGSENERRIDATVLKTVCGDVFAACGMSDADAGLLADSLVMADLRGVHSHGVLRVGEYVEKLLGGVDPRGRPTLVSDRGGALVVDGGNCMGQIASVFAMQAAIERARELNVAVAVVRGSNHCGAMAYYPMQAAAEGMIGLAATNALPTMAPWGGVDKIVGINPISVAIPADREDDIVLDAAFSGSSHGKIRVYAQKGASIPDGWAFDADGQPTNDALAALDGLLQPIGGFKGVGLAIVSGLLSTLLSGACYGTELGNMVDGPRPGADGHFFMALNVAGFVDPETFRRRTDAAIRQVRESRPASGGGPLYVPGGLEAETERLYRQNGIPLNESTLSDIAAAAGKVGADARALMLP